MSLKEGNVPMVDENGVLRSLIWSPRFSTKVAAYTVTAKETGTFFNTTGATAAVVFTLPAISDGPWVFKFLNSVDLDMTVTAGTADTIISFNDVDIDSVAASTSGEKIGAVINAYCDGTSLWVTGESGQPTYQNFALTD
jgi:hypothetical protein